MKPNEYQDLEKKLKNTSLQTNKFLPGSKFYVIIIISCQNKNTLL